ncbi:MAG TPA: hypothetical protein PKO41_00210 [Dokdonella sp.]|uniref:hypothetical protein n=1 Tax=Dokdonella sp. TaxID=2291710 RepID=UPI0025B993AB|nr:hypothetical protein [Dokdonella sp.]MBX3691327.1 hypothetical protein [Dokdonella sp.]MCW5569097.1 hypothetical protein [Dokdonella sp.]HNR90821.1 hypothetical protein [Dokdonella sp.]
MRKSVLVLALLAGACWLIGEFAARATARRLAASLEPNAQLDYAGAGFTWGGGLRLHEPRLRFGTMAEAASLSARSARIGGAGWLWLPLAWLGGANALPAHATIELKAATVSGSPLAAAIGEFLQPPGLVPFSHEGCPGAQPGPLDYARLGITPGERVDRLEYWYDPDNTRLELRFDLERPQVMRLSGSVDLSAFRPALFRDAAARTELRLARGELEFTDSGFLGVRNALCGSRLGVPASDFVAAHMTAVDAFLAARGVSASDSLRALYRNFVIEGGTLRLNTLPDPGWVPANIADYPRGDLLRQLSITARHGSALPVMLQLTFADPVAPLELAGSARQATPHAQTAAEPAPPVALDPAPVAAVVSEAHAAEPVEPAPPATPSTTPVVTPPELAPTPAVPAATGTKPANDATGPLGASAPPPPENSTLALVWKPGVIERLPPPVLERPDYDVVAISALRGYLGRRIRLVTAGGKLVDGELRGITNDHALVAVRVNAGEAEVAVPLANVREARVVIARR